MSCPCPWRIVWCIELAEPRMPFLHPGRLLLPGPDISHGSDIVGDCKLCCHHLCILVQHLEQALLYLFVYRRDAATNAVLTWHETLVTRCDTWHVFTPDISLHHYTCTIARSRATILNNVLQCTAVVVVVVAMMAVCNAVMMPGAVKTLRWLAPWERRGRDGEHDSGPGGRGPGAEQGPVHCEAPYGHN